MPRKACKIPQQRFDWFLNKKFRKVCITQTTSTKVIDTQLKETSIT